MFVCRYVSAMLSSHLGLFCLRKASHSRTAGCVSAVALASPSTLKGQKAHKVFGFNNLGGDTFYERHA